MVANNNKAPRAANNGSNAEKVIQEHLARMEAFGRDKKKGDTAKQNAIELFQADCLSGLANVGMVDRYVNAYDKGAGLSKLSRGSFASALSAFGDPNVIKAWPTFSATLNRMHDSKDKDVKALVSKTVTGKDKFAQLYKVANKVIAAAKTGAVPAITDKWIAESIAKDKASPTKLAELARKAIWDSVPAILPAKPTKAQIEARDNFFKLFGIEAPKAKEKK